MKIPRMLGHALCMNKGGEIATIIVKLMLLSCGKSVIFGFGYETSP